MARSQPASNSLICLSNCSSVNSDISSDIPKGISSAVVLTDSAALTFSRCLSGKISTIESLVWKSERIVSISSSINSASISATALLAKISFGLSSGFSSYSCSSLFVSPSESPGPTLMILAESFIISFAKETEESGEITPKSSALSGSNEIVSLSGFSLSLNFFTLNLNACPIASFVLEVRPEDNLPTDSF